MKRVWLVALSAALASGAVSIAMDDAAAARRGSGVHAGGAKVRHAGNIHRPGVNRAGINRAGINRAGMYRAGMYRAGRPGWQGNYAHWHDRNWNGLGWGLGAAGLAVGTAAAASAYNYGGGDSGYYYPTRAEYTGTYVPVNYIGPICNPRFDPGCQ